MRATKPSTLRQGYHMPHNVAYPEELRLLLEILDQGGPAPFHALSSHLFLEEVKRDVFREFHGKPHECFNDGWSPPDLPTVLAALGSEPLAREFVGRRAERYRALLRGQMSLQAFMESPYKPSSSWRRVWVEYARDYIDFAAMLRMAHRSESMNCRVLDRGREFIANASALDTALLDLTIRVWSDDSLFTIHPFRLTLAMLCLTRDAGIAGLEVKSLMHAVSHLPGDAHIESAVCRLIEHQGDASVELDASSGKEAQRFSLPIRKFLGSRGLVEEVRFGRVTGLAITPRGRKILAEAAPVP